MNEALAQSVVDSPVGPLTVIASDTGIRAVLWPDDQPGRVRDVAATESPTAAQRDILDAAHAQIGEYFAGVRQHFDIPLDPVGTEFQCAAWSALRQIPYGETVSYGEQAERMGDKNKARAVGAANGKNPISIIVPCHRVVGSTGSLTGFAGGVDIKRRLLDLERRVSGQTLL